MKKFKKIAAVGAAALLFTTAQGNGVLQQIYVDMNPMNIVFDGEKKNPPSDMQPMIYNGRTYVPLRYVSELFDKSVDWDGDTRTVYIGEKEPTQKTFYEGFTGPLSKNISLSGNWTADGPNGYKFSKGSSFELTNFFPDRDCDFTVEFEVCVTSIYNYLYLGKGNDDKWDYFLRFDRASLECQSQRCS